APEHSSVPWPPKELKGFSRVTLKPGESRTVRIPLDGRSFAYFDAQGNQWRVEKGMYDVMVGSSSEQIDLHGKINVPQDQTIAVSAPM
ncbi:MAG TPA: fibronectin type III-like domain-contianing protein, partial [Terriglobales bacterium]